MNDYKSINRLIGSDGTDIIIRIMQTKTIGQLKYLRKECLLEMDSALDENTFYKIQSAFIKHKRKLKRVPLIHRPRDWDEEKPF